MVVGSLASSGCSIALSGPDPKRAVSDPPACDTGKGLVGLDGVIGGGLAITTLALAANEEGAGAVVTGLLAAAFIGAAVRGNNEVNECREAMASYSARDVDRALDEPRVARKPAPRRSVQPPSVMQPEPGDPYGDEPPYQAPHVNPAVAAPPPPARPAEPAPLAPTKPATPTKPAAKPAAEPAEEPQDWKDFWTEVP